MQKDGGVWRKYQNKNVYFLLRSANVNRFEACDYRENNVYFNNLYHFIKQLNNKLPKILCGVKFSSIIYEIFFKQNIYLINDTTQIHKTVQKRNLFTKFSSLHIRF